MVRDSQLPGPGRVCAHNLLYWAQGEYLGLGCAAHSHLASPDGSARRWWNVRTPERYCGLVEQEADVEAAGETLPAGKRAAEALVLALRTSSGVPAEVVPEELYGYGLVVPAGPGPGPARAVLTLRGRLLANEVAARLQVGGLQVGR